MHLPDTAAPMNAPPTPPWTPELFQRMRVLFWLKGVGTTLWVWVFFIGYFQTLRHPVYPVTVMPLTVVDAWVPFLPWMLVPYLSLWLYVGIAPGLLRDFRSLAVYGLWSGALCLTGLAIFYVWPSQIPPLPVDASAPGFALLQGIDAAGNACPSMHVAISVFTAVWIERTLRFIGAPAWLRAINVLWLLAICVSTMAVRQHVALDVLGGVLLGGVFAWASLRWSPSERRMTEGKRLS